MGTDTLSGDLPVSAIVTAAEHDLLMRTLVVTKQTDANGVRYAFVAAHVRKAKTLKELLTLALEHPEAAEGSTKSNTLAIYNTPDVLRAALVEAENWVPRYQPIPAPSVQMDIEQAA